MSTSSTDHLPKEAGPGSSSWWDSPPFATPTRSPQPKSSVGVVVGPILAIGFVVLMMVFACKARSSRSKKPASPLPLVTLPNEPLEGPVPASAPKMLSISTRIASTPIGPVHPDEAPPPYSPQSLSSSIVKPSNL